MCRFQLIPKCAPQVKYLNDICRSQMCFFRNILFISSQGEVAQSFFRITAHIYEENMSQRLEWVEWNKKKVVGWLWSGGNHLSTFLITKLSLSSQVLQSHRSMALCGEGGLRHTASAVSHSRRGSCWRTAASMWTCNKHVISLTFLKPTCTFRAELKCSRVSSLATLFSFPFLRQ